MNRKMLATSVFVLLLLLEHTAGAAGTGKSSFSSNGYCNFLYSPSSAVGSSGTYQNGINQSNYSWTSYTGLLGLSLVIVLAMLTVMGFVYGTGRAFGIAGFVDFAKTEYLESLANVVIIVLVAGGMTAVFGLMMSITSIASIGTSALPNAGTQTASTFATPAQMFSALCTHYTGSVTGAVVKAVQLYSVELFISFLTTVRVGLDPNGQGIAPYIPGIEFSPFVGLGILSQTIGTVVGVVVFVAMFNLAMIMVLFVIFYLFPIFLYLGILLRSFPWTRAAGGVFLALFIAFYVVFPALLYPFSLVDPTTSISLTTPAPPGSSLSGLFTFIEAIPSAFLSEGGTFSYSLIEWGISSASGTVMQMFGFIIALIICYDLLEALGDLLGAPSLSSEKLFKKLI